MKISLDKSQGTAILLSCSTGFCFMGRPCRRGNPSGTHGRPTSFYGPGCPMTKTEMKVVRKLKQEGYQVYRNGWPDLLAVKGTRVRLIEVKQFIWTPLSPVQNKMHEIIRKHWLPVETICVYCSNKQTGNKKDMFIKQREESRIFGIPDLKRGNSKLREKNRHLIDM